MPDCVGEVLHLNSEFLLSSSRSIRQTLREAGLVCVRNSGMSASGFEAFAHSLGEPVHHRFLPVEPELRSTTVIERTGDSPMDFIYGGGWHQNLMYMDKPPDATILLATHIGDGGNYTAFIDLTTVFPWLSDGAKTFLSTNSAVHSTKAASSPQNAYKGSRVPIAIPDDFTDQEAVHPCMIADQATGLVWPFVYSYYVTRFAGWLERESVDLIESFRRFAMHDEFVIRHYWEPGDLVLWDNRRFAHRSTVTHHVGRRRLLRNDVSLDWGLEPALIDVM